MPDGALAILLGLLGAVGAAQNLFLNYRLLRMLRRRNGP